jgi:hypothetical protein
MGYRQVLSTVDNLVGLEIGWWTDGRDGQAHFPHYKKFTFFFFKKKREIFHFSL